MPNTPLLNDLIVDLFDAQGSKCFYCGEKMHPRQTKEVAGARGWTKDHVFPKSASGRGMGNNIVLAHSACNAAKGDRPPTQDEITRTGRLYQAIGRIAFHSEAIKNVEYQQACIAARARNRAIPSRESIYRRYRRNSATA